MGAWVHAADVSEMKRSAIPAYRVERSRFLKFAWGSEGESLLPDTKFDFVRRKGWLIEQPTRERCASRNKNKARKPG